MTASTNGDKRHDSPYMPDADEMVFPTFSHSSGMLPQYHTEEEPEAAGQFVVQPQRLRQQDVDTPRPLDCNVRIVGRGDDPMAQTATFADDMGYGEKNRAMEIAKAGPRQHSDE